MATPADEPFKSMLEKGNLAGAATLAVEQYESEVCAYLWARLRKEQPVEEVYSLFLESLWTGLPRFEFRCSMRGWCFALARNACNRFLERVVQRGRRHVPLSDLGPLEEAARRARTRTLPHLRTDVKDKLVELRERLPEFEQTLLMMRVDRRLSWRDIACVLSDDAEQLSEDELRRTVARLRKRFELTKEKLRELAVERGLLSAATTDDDG